LQQLPGLDKTVRQLIRAVQIVGERHAAAGGEHVRAEMDFQRLQGALRDRRGRDRKARPGEYRRCEQQDVERVAAIGHHARLGLRLDDVREIVMGHRMGVEEAVQRAGEVILRALLEQPVHQFGEAVLPEQILKLAAGFGKADGQTAELGGVGRNALAGGEAVAFHGLEPGRRSIRHCTKLASLTLARMHLLACAGCRGRVAAIPRSRPTCAGLV
jgi:DNA-binding transcriptional MerR regulator